MQRRSLIALCAAALVTACATQPAAPVSLADTVAHDPSLATLHRLLGAAALEDTLKSGGPYTLFAPTDEAFKRVPAKTMDELAANPQRLKEVLSYHLLPDSIAAASVKNGKTKAVSGAVLELAKAGDTVTVEDAMVQVADVRASNGILHKVDRVLMPPRRP